MSENFLKSFFALTHDSVYEVLAEEDGFSPVVRKIFIIKGENGVGTAGRLLTGENNMASIGAQIILYSGKEERQIELVENSKIGSGTAPIVALFEKRGDAIEAAKKSNFRFPDQRWAKETKIVLGMIGHNHPVFYIPFGDNFRMKI
jgi:hypothetical protein